MLTLQNYVPDFEERTQDRDHAKINEHMMQYFVMLIIDSKLQSCDTHELVSKSSSLSLLSVSYPVE